MGFGHRVYRAYDPRAAALRDVAQQMGSIAEWLTPRRGRRGRRTAHARGALPGPSAQDERRVLHGRRAPGRGTAAGPLPGHVRGGAHRRLDGARRSSRPRPTSSSGPTCATRVRPSAACPPERSGRRAGILTAWPSGSRASSTPGTRPRPSATRSSRSAAWCDEVLVVDQQSTDCDGGHRAALRGTCRGGRVHRLRRDHPRDVGGADRPRLGHGPRLG